MKITNIKVKTPSNIFKFFFLSSYVFFLFALSLPSLSHKNNTTPYLKKEALDVKKTKPNFEEEKRR